MAKLGGQNQYRVFPTAGSKYSMPLSKLVCSSGASVDFAPDEPLPVVVALLQLSRVGDGVFREAVRSLAPVVSGQSLLVRELIEQFREQLKSYAALVAWYVRAAQFLGFAHEWWEGELSEADAVGTATISYVGKELFYPLLRDLNVTVGRHVGPPGAPVAAKDVAPTRFLLDQRACQGEVEARALSFFNDYRPVAV
jgi:hypothetical protein